uniref:Zinc finger protein 277 n=1 Tax=Sphenodon punctatus TaxID=8508 RepID=A0A8D0GQC4_SPHPU
SSSLPYQLPQCWIAASFRIWGQRCSHDDSKECILEPLSLPEAPGGVAALESPPSVPCIFCEEYSPLAEQNQLLKHMIIEHKLVIADVKLVADFRSYALYWKKRFAEQPITDFCTVIRTNSEAPLEEQDNYFLLCDVLPEDRVLREQLQQKKLKEILEQQQQERYNTSFHGICMFCDTEFTGNRAVLFNHMAKDHAFNVGLPDNIVNCNEFLDTLQKKLDSLQCLYCEKTFRDKNTLKDHMRKKQHRRINAKNREYDRFYIINYLVRGSFQSLPFTFFNEINIFHFPNDRDWSDWEEHPVCAVCLFCEKQADTTEKLYVHMKVRHTMLLNCILFYHQVKLVNFIRREVHHCRCYNCQEKFKSKTELINHMEQTRHITFLPSRSTWDQPQYYFPTYENDTLLCTLSDSEDELPDENLRNDVPVISEDISNLEALKHNSVLNQLLREEIYNEEKV